VLVFPLEAVLLGDALSFAVSALSLSVIVTSFGGHDRHRHPSERRLRSEIAEGLRYVLGDPVLRNLSLMLAVATFFYAPAAAELVYFAKERLRASDTQIGLLFGAGSLGSLLFALAAPMLARRLGIRARTFGAAALKGLLLVSLAAVARVWLGIAIWLLVLGFGTLFSVTSEALKQELVPNELLGRVRSITSVLSWSLIPVGALLGGVLVETTGSPSLLYACAGAGIAFVASFFFVASRERVSRTIDLIEPVTVIGDES